MTDRTAQSDHTWILCFALSVFQQTTNFTKISHVTLAYLLVFQFIFLYFSISPTKYQLANLRTDLYIV